jgi:hypothetical protein
MFMYEEAESAMCGAQSSGDGERVNRSSPDSQLFLICMRILRTGREGLGGGVQCCTSKQQRLSFRD